MHSQEEWKTNHYRIFGKMDQSPMLMPAGFTKQLRDLMDSHDRLVHQVLEMRAHGGRAAAAVSIDDLLPADSGARVELAALLASRSWRVSAPLRWCKRVLRGLPASELDVATMSPTAVAEAIRNIRASSSWRVTAPLRKLRRPR